MVIAPFMDAGQAEEAFVGDASRIWKPKGRNRRDEESY